MGVAVRNLKEENEKLINIIYKAVDGMLEATQAPTSNEGMDIIRKTLTDVMFMSGRKTTE